MKIFALEIKLRAIWVHSLKEKRMIVQSIVKKIRNEFNVSVGEISEQDIHQIIVIGIVGLTLEEKHLEERMEEILHYVEVNTDAEIIDVVKDKAVF
ncbi:DUF503 domain-containing protein [Anaerosporobacter sp.]